MTAKVWQDDNWQHFNRDNSTSLTTWRRLPLVLNQNTSYLKKQKILFILQRNLLSFSAALTCHVVFNQAVHYFNVATRWRGQYILHLFYGIFEMHKKRPGVRGEGGQPIPSWPRVIFSIYPVNRPHSCISPPPPLLTCRKLNCTLVCTLCTVHPTFLSSEASL